ncbi:aminoacyl-histidine dipeptidase [Microbacter margulisiae]|uniref:Cytosol non-specific dipeptidase n=1 Tax=Microbacter margulisiae TaxID=1350067 RepID=A0A7W5DNT1_9PORP|nr:aminoacyl-histidine dipeptidase [Microbacter margulisiae]MBB3186342.1 dipeptidase D [Microbacter margulisiae]
MSILDQLQPALVWHYFNEIRQVPRPSKKESKIIAYLQETGKKLHLETITDAAGNVIIRKPAIPGKENRPTVILQSHMDMVCEKNNDVTHDFLNDPIEIYIEDNWVKAKGTTLGADNGIGIAASLAVLASDDVQHGPIECLFTVDEETGLTGAAALQPNILTGNILLNLDSEDDGEIFIGCAGGIDTVATLPFEYQNVPDNYFWALVEVKGLTGGHSGDDIDKGFANANKVLNRFLWQQAHKTSLRIASIDGGNLRNAIAREAHAVIGVPNGEKESLRVDFNVFAAMIEKELEHKEPNIRLELSSETAPEKAIDKKTTDLLLNALYACPHGVIRMSDTMPGLVETSTNLASVKMSGNTIIITTSQRSSIDSAKHDVAAMVNSVFTLAGASVQHGEGYPGWQPNPESPVVKLTASLYEKLFQQKPHVRAIHAGLECGLFLEKYPQWDMVSFGPTIRGAHSPSERLDIVATQRFWKLLITLLAEI